MKQIILCALYTIVICMSANAKSIFIGSVNYPLSETKYTTPSLSVFTGDEHLYAPVTKIQCNGKLHIMDETGNTYNVVPCESVFTDTEHYTYDEYGNLVGANDDVYLESTGTQYINSGIKPNQDTQVKISVQVDKDTNRKATAFIFGARQWPTGFVIHALHNTGKHWFFQYANQYTSTNSIQDFARHNIFFDKNVIYIDDEISAEYKTAEFSLDIPMYIFAMNEGNAKKFSGKIWHIVIYSDGVLQKNFVPVPKCMKIGDNIIPENGMFDTVEQKFYCNDGTDEFIYGVDET